MVARQMITDVADLNIGGNVLIDVSGRKIETTQMVILPVLRDFLRAEWPKWEYLGNLPFPLTDGDDVKYTNGWNTGMPFVVDMKIG